MKSPAPQMTLAPEPRPNCMKNPAVWKVADGNTKQICCCPDCTRLREEAAELARVPHLRNLRVSTSNPPRDEEAGNG